MKKHQTCRDRCLVSSSSLNHQKGEPEGLGNINHAVLKLPHYLFLRKYIGGILMKSSFSFSSGTPGLSGWLTFRTWVLELLPWSSLSPVEVLATHNLFLSLCPRKSLNSLSLVHQAQCFFGGRLVRENSINDYREHAFCNMRSRELCTN